MGMKYNSKNVRTNCGADHLQIHRENKISMIALIVYSNLASQYNATNKVVRFTKWPLNVTIEED